MARANALLSSSVAVAVLTLMAAPVALAPALLGSGYAFAADEPDSTTVPDDTYGEGGTRQSFADDKHELLSEVWRDKNGIVREQFEAAAGGEQFWGFFNGDGTGNPSEWRNSVIAIRPMARPADRWEMWVIGPDDTLIKQWSTLSRAELDTEFAYWHAQLRIWVNTARRRQQGETG